MRDADLNEGTRQPGQASQSSQHAANTFLIFDIIYTINIRIGGPIWLKIMGSSQSMEVYGSNSHLIYGQTLAVSLYL